ncbi:MAG: hypothetical protein ACI97R_001915 [Candidatus Azotimanducaceae bacterium]|jgi:hypothetical protein
MYFIDNIRVLAFLLKSILHIYNPGLKNNLLMKNLIKSLKNTTRLVKNVTYVAMKVLLLT